jgi:hypothetical protein
MVLPRGGWLGVLGAMDDPIAGHGNTFRTVPAGFFNLTARARFALTFDSRRTGVQPHPAELLRRRLARLLAAEASVLGSGRNAAHTGFTGGTGR